MEEIKKIISNVVQDITDKKQYSNEKIERIWDQIITEHQKKHVKLIGINENILKVNVDAPSWLFQFKMRKKTILKNIQEEIPNIEDIVFKIGKTT